MTTSVTLHIKLTCYSNVIHFTIVLIALSIVFSIYNNYIYNIGVKLKKQTPSYANIFSFKLCFSCKCKTHSQQTLNLLYAACMQTIYFVKNSLMGRSAKLYFQYRFCNILIANQFPLYLYLHKPICMV